MRLLTQFVRRFLCRSCCLSHYCRSLATGWSSSWSWQCSGLLSTTVSSAALGGHFERSVGGPVEARINATTNKKKHSIVALNKGMRILAIRYLYLNKCLNWRVNKFPSNYTITLTQQQAETVICIVFLPGWHTSFRYSGLCDVLFSPLSMINGVALTDTWTLAGQFVFICRSSWWKHFSCNSRSDLKL